MKLSIKYHIVNVSFLGILFILTMTLAICYQAGIINGSYLLPPFISIVWLCIGSYAYIVSDSERNKDILKVIKLFLIPWMAFIVYNCIIFSSQVAHQPFVKSSFVQIMFSPIIILGSFGSYIVFKKDTLRYFLYAIFISYILTLVTLFFKMGSVQFFSGISNVLKGESVSNPFEQNSDLVLALGLLLFYYLDSFIRKRSGEIVHPIIIIILIFLGGKRIEVLAIVFLIGINILLHILPEDRRGYLHFVISLGMQLTMYTFVYVTISGLLSQYIYSHDINTMGRIKMWDYVAQFVRFSPDYFGKGYSFSNLLLEQKQVLTYQGTTYVLHSDVLKVFYDLGFAMFTFWGVYNLFILPSKLRKLFGFELSNLVWTMTVYLFILYFTDNAINYFINQTLFVILTMQTLTLKNEYYAKCTAT